MGPVSKADVFSRKKSEMLVMKEGAHRRMCSSHGKDKHLRGWGRKRRKVCYILTRMHDLWMWKTLVDVDSDALAARAQVPRRGGHRRLWREGRGEKSHHCSGFERGVC